jgi:hypothetical protein
MVQPVISLITHIPCICLNNQNLNCPFIHFSLPIEIRIDEIAPQRREYDTYFISACIYWPEWLMLKTMTIKKIKLAGKSWNDN